MGVEKKVKRKDTERKGSRLSGSPWNAETTACLPGQFYSSVVSHLSRRPSNTEHPSPFCVFIYLVSASEDAQGSAWIGSLSQMSSDKWCVKPTREGKGIIQLSKTMLRVTLSYIQQIIINELWTQNTHPDQPRHICFKLDLSKAVHLRLVLARQINAYSLNLNIQQK